MYGIGKKVVQRQVAAALAVSAGFFFMQGQAPAWAAWSALYGGLVAVLLSLFLAVQLRRLDKRLENREMVSTGLLILGVAPRMLLVLAAFAAGIIVWRFQPLPMLAAFTVCYLAWWLSLREARQ